MTSPDSGYLVARTFYYMYEHFSRPAAPGDYVYSIPTLGASPKELLVQYRGLGRDVLSATYPKIEAVKPPLDSGGAHELAKLEEEGLSEEDFIFEWSAVERVLAALDDPQGWEVIWTKDEDASVFPPAATTLAGYEPTWFIGDHFSPLCDAMFFPRWHGTDSEGTLFRDFHQALNENGLFASSDMARSFADLYEAQDWAESGPFTVAAVFLVEHRPR